MHKVVVTGAGGFVGSHLCDALVNQAHDVVGVDVHFPTLASCNDCPYRMVQSDFRNTAIMREVLDGADVLFHLASAHLQISLRDSEYWDINARSIPGLVRAAKECGVRRVVHVSSVGVYGDTGQGEADERTPPSPQSIYGETKLAGETAAIAAGRENELEVVVLRPAWIYGPRCPRTLKLYRALLRRRFIMIGSGDNMRHPIYIDDMVRAIMLAAERQDIAGDVLVIAGDRAITTRSLIDSFVRVLNVPAPRVHIPLWLGRLLAVGVETASAAIRREPPVSRRTLEFFQSNNAFCIDRAKERLGFRPTVTFDDGLEQSRPWLMQGTAKPESGI